MKIRALTCIAGNRPDTGEPFTFLPDSRNIVDDEWGEALVSSGLAQAVEDGTPSTVAGKAKSAVKRARRAVAPSVETR